MGAAAEGPLLLLGEPSAPGVRRLAELLEGHGHAVEVRSERQLAPGTVEPGSASVILIAPEALNKAQAARAARRVLPRAHILFLAEEGELAALRGQLTVAPMLGTHWSIVSPRPEPLLAALSSALAATAQRRQLRTTLDRINVLISERPAQDSPDFHKLVVSDRYLASILDFAQDAILSIDRQGRLATWNRGAQSLFGIAAEQATGRPLTELLAPSQRELALGWLASARQGSPVAQRELTCLRSDGFEFIAEVTLAPIWDDGRVIAVSLIARDVSERKRHEAELERVRAELEERVAQRTEDLRSLNQELEAFTYSASHDLRAPLRGIDGFSQALLEDYGDKLDAGARGYVERIRAGARRMADIIDSLLLLSRISRAELELRPVDLSALAESAAEELREEFPERRVEVEIERGLTAMADTRLMRIVMENLFSNAWKFTRERERAEIRFGAAELGEEVVACLSDNGAGFDMAYSDKLFMPFQRLHHPGRFEGTGVGLGTVQRIVQRHGGRIWAEGEVGGGARFYFTLPSLSRPRS